MARTARVVVPGYPHHVTQRGNRKQATFFKTADYRAYLTLMAECCKRHNVTIWAYCLMPNHVHLIAVPSTPEGLAKAIGEAHRRYSRIVNKREGWIGHLWQERFASFVMDETYLLAAVRYVEMNPVDAGLVERPEDYPWSSAKAHMAARDDGLVSVKPMLEIVGSWKDFLATDSHAELALVKAHEKSGKPLGPDKFTRKVYGNRGQDKSNLSPLD